MVKTVYASVIEDISEHFDEYAKVFVKNYDDYNVEEKKIITNKNHDLYKKLNMFLGKSKLI